MPKPIVVISVFLFTPVPGHLIFTTPAFSAKSY